jgi:hypothetical protein
VAVAFFLEGGFRIAVFLCVAFFFPFFVAIEGAFFETAFLVDAAVDATVICQGIRLLLMLEGASAVGEKLSCATRMQRGPFSTMQRSPFSWSNLKKRKQIQCF